VNAIFYGEVDVGSTIFAPLITTSYQHEYGNIYTATTDIYSPTYATGIDTLLPSVTPIDTIYSEGLLPELSLFDSMVPVVASSPALTAALAVPSNPVFASGFGSPYLIINNYRVSYVLDAASNPDGAVPPQTQIAGVPLAAAPPTQTLRLALYLNDMRNGNWVPEEPTLLCGGGQDPTVFFSVNTTTMQTFWSNLPAGLITVLDVNGTPAGPFAAIQTGFQGSQAALLAYYESAAGGGLSAAAAQEQIVQNYHTNVAPFCTLAARSFFSQF
jgi:hypothetical protein